MTAVSGAKAGVVCFGECMIELSRDAEGRPRVSHGGDTLNTAVGLARLGVPVAYLTAVGADAWSADMKRAWREEGVDVSLTLTHPVRAPGLYAISTDALGERAFTYWRDASAARDFFGVEGVEAALETAARADLLFLSGITLAIFDPPARARTIDLARAVRARGGRVAFDPNWRPRLWPDVATFQAAVLALAPHVDVALPSFDDEEAVWGDRSPEAAHARWRGLGVAEVVVKNGARGALTDEGWARADVIDDPLDTTGAGDAFNAGHLARRLAGETPSRAAAFAARLAAATVRHPGAIMPRSAMAAFVAGEEVLA